MFTVMLAGLLIAAPTAAQPGAQPVQADPNPPGSIVVNGNRKRWDPERMVCREVVLPGSRLNVKKICRTMLEWASTRREDQQLLIQKQYNGAP
jgi:hypothetical protein